MSNFNILVEQYLSFYYDEYTKKRYSLDKNRALSELPNMCRAVLFIDGTLLTLVNDESLKFLDQGLIHHHIMDAYSKFDKDITYDYDEFLKYILIIRDQNTNNFYLAPEYDRPYDGMMGEGEGADAYPKILKNKKLQQTYIKNFKKTNPNKNLIFKVAPEYEENDINNEGLSISGKPIDRETEKQEEELATQQYRKRSSETILKKLGRYPKPGEWLKTISNYGTKNTLYYKLSKVDENIFSAKIRCEYSVFNSALYKGVSKKGFSNYWTNVASDDIYILSDAEATTEFENLKKTVKTYNEVVY